MYATVPSERFLIESRKNSDGIERTYGVVRVDGRIWACTPTTQRSTWTDLVIASINHPLNCSLSRYIY
jgi:hypothetical protein